MELPREAFAVLQDPGIGPTVIISTIDIDGAPHAAPFGSLRAISPRSLRFGCDRKHDTYANILRDGRVCISLVAPPDIALSIKGRAKVVKEQMDLLNSDAIVEVSVEEVKNDLLPQVIIETPIAYSVPKDVEDLIRKYVDEVRDEQRRTKGRRGNRKLV